MSRKLTKYFGTYNLAKYEKATGKGVMDLLDIGNFEITKIANLIKLGNEKDMTEEQVYQILDTYLAASPDNSLITAYFDLLDELDGDIKILKSCGVKVEDLKAEFTSMANDMGSKLKENLNTAKIPDKPVETDESNENKVIDLPVTQVSQV